MILQDGSLIASLLTNVLDRVRRFLAEAQLVLLCRVCVSTSLSPLSVAGVLAGVLIAGVHVRRPRSTLAAPVLPTVLSGVCPHGPPLLVSGDRVSSRPASVREPLFVLPAGAVDRDVVAPVLTPYPDISSRKSGS